MSSPDSTPNFDTVEKHSNRNGDIMLLACFSDGSYIQADPNSDGDGFSLFWATDQDPLESLASTARTCGLPAGESAFLTDDEDYIEDGDSAEIIRAIWRDRNRTISSFMIEGSTFDINWSGPSPKFKWSNREYSQIGLNVKGLRRAYVEALLITSGVDSVQNATHRTLTEFAAHIPLLRQA
jgi:hypothetical protein